MARGDERDRLNRIARDRSAGLREIGPLPKVKSPARRKRTADSLLAFLLTYFPRTFHLDLSDDQREVIAEVERVVTDGGQMGLAMPRGSGKTSIAVRAALWALLTGRRKFVVLIAAEAGLANALVSVLRDEMSSNELLASDYPESLFPIHALEGQTKRQQGQTLDGRLTKIKLTADEIVLPTVAKSKASGGVVRAVGITGSLRGMIATADGQTIRPDLILVDDPQTRESARSATQTAYRFQLLNSDVLGLSGPGVRVACMALVTVVCPNDLSSKLLDREDQPAWQGRRYQMLDSLPSDLEGWDEYAEHRRHSLRQFGDNRLGNEFYTANRERLDAGAVATWPARYEPGELSAVQSAMNIRIDRPEAFASEFQNCPLPADLGVDVKEFIPSEVAKRVNGHERCVVPPGCTLLTAFFDLGGSLHWYAVVAWNPVFGGAVIDAGCWPRQSRSFFAADDARPSLKDWHPGMTEEQRVFAGLESLVPTVLGRTYSGAEGGTFQVERALIDAGKWPDAVYQHNARSPHGGLIFPSKGVGRSTTSAGVAKWKLRPGERAGYHWRLTLGTTSGRGRQIQHDPDAWKSFLHSSLNVPLGGQHGLTLWGKNPAAHELLGEHVGSEYSTPATLRGDTFDKWVMRPDRRDNHLLDCLVGCAVAASVAGLKWQANGQVPPKKEKTKPKAVPAPHERKRITGKRVR